MALIGRDLELERCATALRERRRLAIVGEAGGGKTALLRAATTGVATLAGGGLSTLSWLPFLPIARAFGAPLQQTTAFQVAQLVIDRTADGSVLVLDDLHWADGDTLQVLALLPPETHVLAALRDGDSGSERALEALERSGFELLQLAPLDDEDASRLVEQSTVARTVDIATVVARAGGNPLLLEELARSDRQSSTLGATVRARLAALPDDARRDFSLLALGGRPLPPELVPAADVLRVAGLVTITDTVSPRHALLADAAVGALDDDTRAELHARLAELADDVGGRARHLAAAGQHEAAHEAALEAAAIAGSPGERAEHLALAASLAAGADADALRLEAAQGLYDLRRLEEADALVQAVVGSDPETRAHAYLLEKLVALNLGDAARAETAIAEGLRLVSGSGSAIEIRLLISATDIPLFVHGDAEEAVRLGTKALDVARARGLEEARAYAALATSLTQAGRSRSEWEPCFLQAIEHARRDGDGAREIYAAMNLGVALEELGALDEAAALSREMISRAEALGLQNSATGFKFGLFERQASIGDLEGAVVTADAVLGGPADLENRLFFLYRKTLALIDLGRFDEAGAALTALRAVPRIRHDFAEIPSWVECELLFWSGKARESLTRATTVSATLEEDPGGIVPHLAVIAAHAALEVGAPLPPVPAGPYWERRARAAAEEVAALSAYASGAPDGVAALVQATQTWRDLDIRGELRCAWRTGEALLATGALDEGRHLLQEAERRGQSAKMSPVLARIGRALRRAGESRSAPRSVAGMLTGREAEVLNLVGEGLSNAQIASRLGLALGTVKRLVASGSEKLGARTRAQAAALAAEQRTGS